jgi:hypothetical protein
VTVRAQSLDGTFINETTLRIPLQKPALLLYEDHPLFGTLFNRAITTQDAFPEKNMTIAAIPFYAPVLNSDDSSLRYDWIVNNTKIVSTSSIRSKIELGATADNSIARIQLAISSAANLFFNLSNAWNITLSPSQSTRPPSASTPANNRFTNTQ